MCLIILNISPDRTSKEDLEISYSLNKDGAGVAYNLNNQIILKKGFKDFEEFYNYYLQIPTESNILIHHRLISAGDDSEENLHPFSVSEDLVFAMNGTLNDYKFKDAKQSDTAIFNQTVLRPLHEMDKEFYKKPFLKRILEGHVKTAKFVFLNNLGEFYIWNEQLGSWEVSSADKNQKSWFSNSLYKTKKEEKKKAKKQKAMSLFHQNNQHLSRYDGKTKYFLENMGSGTPPNLKKKYYLRSDNLYRELSLDELFELSKEHHRGIRKLVKSGIIGKLDSVPPEKLKAVEKARYDSYWHKKGFLEGEISSHILNPSEGDKKA